MSEGDKERVNLEKHGVHHGRDAQDVGKSIGEEIDKHNKKVEKDNEKKARNDLEGIGNFAAKYARNRKSFYFRNTGGDSDGDKQ